MVRGCGFRPITKESKTLKRARILNLALVAVVAIFLSSCAASQHGPLPTAVHGISTMSAALPEESDGSCPVGYEPDGLGGCVWPTVAHVYSQCRYLCLAWFGGNGTDMAATYLGPGNTGVWVACDDPSAPGCYSVVANPCYVPPGADDGQGHTAVKDAINGNAALQSLLAFLANHGVVTRISYNTTDLKLSGQSSDGKTKYYKDAEFSDTSGFIRDSVITVYTRSLASNHSDLTQVIYHEYLHSFFFFSNAGVVTNVYNIPHTGTATATVDGYTYSYDLHDVDDRAAFEHIEIHNILQGIFQDDATGAAMEGIWDFKNNQGRPRTDAGGNPASSLDMNAAKNAANTTRSTQITTAGASALHTPPANQICANGAAAAAIYTMATTTDNGEGVEPPFTVTHVEVEP